MKNHVYKVEINGAYHAYVSADNANEAKREALKHVTVERVPAGEIIILVQRGVAISVAGAEQAGEQTEAVQQ